MAGDDFSDVFSDDGGSSSEVATETTEVSTEVEGKGETEADNASTETKTETSVETKAEDDKSEESAETASEQNNYTPEHRAAIKQAKDERQKRQARDARIAELEAELNGKAEKPKLPDVFEDQEGFAEGLLAQQSEVVRKAKLDIARDMMKDRFSDYEEVEATVLEEMSNNPVLKAELQKADNPAKAVYEYGLKMREFNEVKGFKKDELEARIRAEVKAELEKQYGGTQTDERDDGLSPSLAGARGSANNDERGIETLDDVFG